MEIPSGHGSSSPFKTCMTCGHEWADLAEFVKDSELQVNGYQASFDSAENGLFCLTHECPNCHSTLAIKAVVFVDWHVGPRIEPLNALKDTCERHCVKFEDLDPCSATCSMRWVREVLQYLRNHEIPAHVSRIATANSASTPS